MIIEQFLARVVAPGNYACINWKTPGRNGMGVRFFPGNALGDAASYLRWISGKGADAYFALASYNLATPDGVDPHGRLKFKGERKHENVQALRAFWIDVDVKRVGDGKTKSIYATRVDAVQWLGKFLKATSLPPPNLWMNSGYGFHWYWVLEDPMPRADWQPYADALRDALNAHGFLCEAGLSSDSARILRPPETQNQKAVEKGGQPAPVEVMSKYTRGDYPNQFVLDRLKPYMGLTPASPTVVAGTSVLAGSGPAAAFTSSHANMAAAAQANLPVVARPRSFALLATKCEQVKQSLAAGGHGDHYQLWYLGFLSLAHHCEDGAQFVHPISQGDPRYSPPNVDAHVARVAAEKGRKDSGPPLCASFDRWRPGVCQTCPFNGQVTSPWNLGLDDDAPTQASGMALVHVAAGGNGSPITAWPAELAPDSALALVNRTFFFTHDWGGEPLIGHQRPDGVRPVTEQQFRAMTANRYVATPKFNDKGTQIGVDRVALGKFWLGHPARREYDRTIYDPENCRSSIHERAFNLWTGFARTPNRAPWPRMARHIFEVLCRRDREVWRYLIRWLAHAVKHPGTAPGVVIVLKSDAEGSGKSSVLEWLARMFGEHALMLSTPEDLIGQFNDHLESRSLIGLNEPAFPGNHQAAGKLKSMITEPTWLINGKFRAARRVPNIAHILLTTNASWAVPAGNQARRFLVLEVDEKYVGNRAYFTALWSEADHGGVEAMLHALLRIDLTNFSSLDAPKTKALRLQQIRSAPSTTRWGLDAVTAAVLLPSPPGTTVVANAGFGSLVSTTDLYQAYKFWAADARERPVSHVEFGRWLGKCGFRRKVAHGGTPTYDIPDPGAFYAAVLRQAGI